jgi:hypothetical protein
MNSTTAKIEAIKKEGYDIDFGTIFNNAFENFKKIALYAGFAFILLSIIFMAIFFGFLVVLLGVSGFEDGLANFKPEHFSAMGTLFYIVGLIFFSALISPFMAGILKMAQYAAKQQEFSSGTIFHYYQGPHFKEIFMATAVITFFTSTFTVGLQLVGYNFLGVLVSFMISFLTFLTIPLIIFGNLKAMEAIKGSMIVVSKQIFILMGLLIVSLLFTMLGIFGFCIGIFFTLPFIYSMYYSIYNEIIGDNDTEEESEIDTLLI